MLTIFAFHGLVYISPIVCFEVLFPNSRAGCFIVLARFAHFSANHLPSYRVAKRS